MAYDPQIFKDRAVEFPNRYITDGGGQVTLSRDPGEVYAEGTPINAQAMNALSKGVFDAKRVELSTEFPTQNDNALKGFSVGDTWIRGRKIKNVVPGNWSDPDQWKWMGSYTNIPASMISGDDNGSPYIGVHVSNYTLQAGQYVEGGGQLDLKAMVPVAAHRYYIGFSIAPAISNIDPLEISVEFGPSSMGRVDMRKEYGLGSAEYLSIGAIVESSAVNEVVLKLLAYIYFDGSSTGEFKGVDLKVMGLMLFDIDALGLTFADDIAALDYFFQRFSAPKAQDAYFERYFESTPFVNATINQTYLCTFSSNSYAHWTLSPELTQLQSVNVVAGSGVTIDRAAFWRTGSEILFEIEMTNVTARTAGANVLLLSGMTHPRTTQRFEITNYNAGKTAIVAGSFFGTLFGLDYAGTASVGSLYLTAVTAVAAATKLVCCGSYLIP